MKCLSFSEQFFSGDGSVDLYDVQPSDRPTSVYQAIISLPEKTRRQIARHVFKVKDPVHYKAYADSESFPFDVLEKARETDLCDGYESPVLVYIDLSQRYWVDVYDRDDEE